MKKLSRIKEFIKYVRGHRKQSMVRAKQTIDNYNFTVRMCIKCNEFFHDLHKISPFSVSKYSEIYDELIRDIDFPRHCLKYEFSQHDEWIYTPLAIETIRDSKLFRIISRFNREETLKTYEDLVEFVDNIKTVCELFGENPASFYLRNYYSFGLDSHRKRKVVELLLEIEFDDYFDYDVDATVEQAFDKYREEFCDQYSHFVFMTCLNRYGVNMYEVLKLNDTYEGINDEVNVVV